MGHCNLRSLLLAAIVISNCITWTASRHHYTHNVSGHRSRHRRQGAGLYLPASYVIPGGEGGGAWGEWGEVSSCSRTCGGGVASQKRICLQVGPDGQPLCTGGDTKYFSCQTQDCPEGSKDFRAEQCSEYDNISFRGIRYNWVPYTKAPNPCELNCMPRGERFYYRQRSKVIDGTRCNDESFDVCVDGTCQPVGCDMMLGSNAREDKCRECRGNGTNCHTINGLIDTQDLRKGYNDVLLIPQGATSIVIAEIRPSNNYLALRAKQDNVYYLNGEYHIDFPRSLVIAGTLWHYERSQQGFAAPDKLRSLGPTTEPLYLSLLLQDVNVGIEYEYSIPTALAPPPNQQYNWVHEDFTECSTTCGGGFQTRSVSCRSREELQIVDDSLCDEGLKPVTNQTCNTQACAARWVEGPWSPCSKACGEGGTRSREVHCEKIITNGFPSVVADKECFELLGPKPELYQECNEDASCPTWFAGPWKPCDRLCDEGKQTRQVVCHQRSGGRVQILADEDCADEKPPAEQSCILHPCDGVDWVLSDWSGCDSCLSTLRTRVAKCATKDRTVVDSSLCSYHPTPVLQESCDLTKLPSCTVQWYATQWSNCSAQCGKGVQTRRVFCGQFDGMSVLKVPDNRCENETKYNDSKPCEIPKEKCPAKWFAGPWSECTKECGGGEQFRRTMCLIGGEKSDACDGDVVPDSTQGCNTGPCDKDEMLPVDSKSTPIMDDEYDYEDCEEDEEYPEVGVDEDIGDSSSTFEELMFSDSPFTTDEGSGTGSTSFTEIESEFTSESGSGLETFITEGSGSESSTSGESTETGSGYTSGSTESTIIEASESSSKETDETESTETGSTETGSMETSSTESSSTETDSTETDYSTETDITDTGSTETESTETDSMETRITETGTTETDSTETGSSETSNTENGSTATDSTKTDSTETDNTDTGSTETDSTKAGSTETGSTETDNTETGSTETGSTETGSTETGSTETGSTETSNTETGSTETGSTETELTESATTVSASTETTEENTTETSSSGSSSEPSATEGSTTEGETGSTEIGKEETGTTETGTEETETTETNTTGSRSTETTGESSKTTETGTESSTESRTEETSSTETSSTETGSTEPTETESSTATAGITDTSETISTATGSTETGSTETEVMETSSTESGTTETGFTESTETSVTETGTMETTESGPTETTEAAETGSTESTTEGTSTPSISSEETSTSWDWKSTVDVFTKKPRCKAKKRAAKCIKSKFGCCPDKRTPAAGPFDEGCPTPKTCKESKFGCCPDGVSPAAGPKNKGCPITPCNETLFGCCFSDNITPAEGNDQEGCPPPPPACKSSKYGCCKDGETEAKGPNKKGCPETEPKKAEGCAGFKFGCCLDNKTEATGPNGEGCPCGTTEFGCCPDGVTSALGAQMEGCAVSCNTSTHGCCPDGETPAHGPEYEGCCLQYSFGCCPDNYKPAEGPHLEGCGCQYARFGCCPDNMTIALGSNKEGCGCQYTEYGCCPDRHTVAPGPNFEGCGCHTYQFGCCPDGVTIAKGPNLQGCQCQQSKYGCCGDGVTAASGPSFAGCDCSSSKYGCCPDGQTEAQGEKFLGCTDVPENRQAACSLATDRGPCRNYSVYWYYDMEYGGCSRFWYGGCEGNGNRFNSKEECEDVCVQPPPKDACKLPKVKGACVGYYLRWYYDSAREQCGQFVFGGCLGNANNFESQEQCQTQCEPARSDDQCKLPIQRGSCAGNFVRWGFNTEVGRCEQFIWGGCEGNNNRFSSEAACVQRCDPPGTPKPQCSEPQEVGNCTEKHPTWSFSQTENRCVPFYYSGCGGNGNKFETRQSCEEACPSAYVQDVCTLPALTGECANYREKWFYDTAEQRCRQFYYGGCGGNGNNFATERECQTRCSEPAVFTITTTTQTQAPEPFTQEFCFLEKDPGPCNQFATRWAYDSALGTCSPFEYGGCGGNRNNFPTHEYCSYYCEPTQDICQLPMRSGPCNDSLMRWFYDPVTDACSQFTYGGCEGNDNRFESQQECERRCRTGQPQPEPTPATTTTTTIATVETIPRECETLSTLEKCVEAGEVWYYESSRRECVPHQNDVTGDNCRRIGTFASQEACERSCGAFRNFDVCRYPVDSGPCREMVPKFYYDEGSRSCQQFMYGGCHGGPNRFSTIGECEQICKPETDPCKQPAEPGNCLEYFIKWYYNEARDICHQFVYSGCSGNDNRFDSQEECEGRCKKHPSPQVTITSTTTTTITTINTTIAPYTPPQQVYAEECRTPDSLEPCERNITVFYYDSSLSACRSADIGGCRHPNSYRSEEECERRCGAFRGLDPCTAPLDPGPCRAALRKVFWDAASGSCQPFAYGGCAGGPNRFSSVDECEEVCASTGPEPACRLPVATGSPACGAPPTRRWRYSELYGDCLVFVYYGCDGNDNNFLSYEHCAEVCKPDPLSDPNEVLPDCDRFNEECSRLRCQYGLQRTRTVDGCERCSCVQVETDCEPLTQECQKLKCNYGIEKTVGEDGCERCKCIDHPCAKKTCPSGERCVATAYRDAITQEPRYSADCRTVNKPGACPEENVFLSTEGSCRRECNDDADCRGAGKCCAHGCSQLCLEPAVATSPHTPATSPLPRTTYVPELPQAPQANPETEPEVTSSEGGKVTLRCLFHGNPPPKITWRRGEIVIDGSVDRYRLLSDGALEIVSLYRTDSGVYICVADNGLGTARQEIRLQVTDAVEGPAGIAGDVGAVITAELGQTLNIGCLAYGYPQPTIAWYRGIRGPMVPYSSKLYEARGNVLTIRKLDLETLGEYACQAYNGIGKPASWSVVVQAYRPHGGGSWSSPYLVEKEKVVVVTPREPRTETTTTPTPEYEVPVYTVPVSTNIVAEYTTVAAGSELSLPCEVDGYPVPDVFWTKDGNRLSPSDRMQVTEARLTISGATVEDSGVYGCHASNAFSSHHSTVQINVQGLYIPAKCTDNPFFANCQLIVRSKFCHHKYYSKFCCKSCVEAGQLNPQELDMQADDTWTKRK